MKTYIKPEVKSIEIKNEAILTGSVDLYPNGTINPGSQRSKAYFDEWDEDF